MGSLQDQLLKSGLVTEDKLRRSAAEQRRKNKKSGKAPKAKRSAQPAESSAAQRARDEKRERDKALNLERQRNRERNARMAKVRDFIQPHVLNDETAEIPYHVNAGRKIKRIYVTAAQREQLKTGELLVIIVDGKARLFAGVLVEKIRALDPDARIIGPQSEPQGKANDAGDYAGYEVPDDLMW